MSECIANARWILTDPMGGRHVIEKKDGTWGKTDGVHAWICQEIEYGRLGRVYGWTVKLDG